LRTRLVGVHESEEREAARLRAARRANERARAASLEAAAAPRAALAPSSLSALEPPEPTRLLDAPIALGVSVGGDGRLPPLRPGVTLDVGGDTFVVDAIRFDRRLDGIAWWSESAASRDYLRVTLVGDEPRGAASSRAERFVEPENDRRDDRVTGVVVAGPWQRAGGAASTAPRRAAHRGPVAEAWVYVDRRTGEVFLQGWWE
ncbi:MAG TPA: hypothetical protein VL400_04725, partial [Polyangiaceae bacterium]|nr:hypothetical protein [Polyangiaceae bacterium]